MYRLRVAYSRMFTTRLPPTRGFGRWKSNIIGLYLENAIAIESETRDPNGGNVHYVTMQITFHIPECGRMEGNLNCDVVHITTVWVPRLILDLAIAAIQTSR